MKKKINKENDGNKVKENAVKVFFEAIGEEHGFGRFNLAYNWLYHCGLKDSEVRVVHYILNFTLNGRPCMSRKSVIAFNLGITERTVERAIATLRDKKVITGTKKSNPKKNGRYTGSHIPGGYLVNGKQLMLLFQENFKPEDQPLRIDDQQALTEQFLSEIYGGGGNADALPQDPNHQAERAEELVSPKISSSTNEDLSSGSLVPSDRVKESIPNGQKLESGEMTPEEDNVFGSFKKVIVTNTETDEIFEFQSPLRAFIGMQNSIQNEDYSSKSVARQLMGGEVDVHESFVFRHVD